MITNISEFKKAPSRLLGRRVVYLYSNKGKCTTGRITTVSSANKKLLKLCVTMDDGTTLLRSWKSFGLLD
ncbi:hypothetical protein PQC55_gp131 [Escherichia phage vB_EcoP-CHD5UKE1]|uniref:Uncharacterized protein n=2 Tax=Kuravirus SU10 TaxID=1987942 RepID=A0A0B4N298_9CAUD|nr:hypothetical protein ACQ52_gp118 [Escherichia phage vB_EcoP_SU10]YP_010674037.1 hypothetical protein PQC55_gp131 [Escherichia phage vB_EcoP-CHD5UKE1]AIF71869.1 hypothetical protein SU10_0118 [Escherichia phage vB_EcoP_SU10]QZI80627.1 hypothetical protein CHD5UKE1_131 [Escherichia phage vB_EcoP-CHD5UKE1]